MVDLKTMLSSKAIQVPEEAIFDSQVSTTETLRIQHHQPQFIHLNDSEFYTLYSVSGEKKEDGGVEQVSFHIFGQNQYQAGILATRKYLKDFVSYTKSFPFRYHKFTFTVRDLSHFLSRLV